MTSSSKVLKFMTAKREDPNLFYFENLKGPSYQLFFSQADIYQLFKIATSLKLAAKLDEKLRLIDKIMRSKGFRRLSSGTNRIVYKHLEDQSIVCKVALDRVGLADNPGEFRAQDIIKPWCAKMFSVSQNGEVGIAERVMPIVSFEEFEGIASDIFDILSYILGECVMDDIGSEYWRNFGTRYGICPVILDYPNTYRADINKMFCINEDPITGLPCNGEIDYDDGLNHIICTKCGCEYNARDLALKWVPTSIKGGIIPMKVRLRVDGKVVAGGVATSDTIMHISKPKQPTSSDKVVARARSKAEVYGYNEAAKTEQPVDDEPRNNETTIDTAVEQNNTEVVSVEQPNDTYDTDEDPTIHRKPYYLNDDDDDDSTNYGQVVDYTAEVTTTEDPDQEESNNAESTSWKARDRKSKEDRDDKKYSDNPGRFSSKYGSAGKSKFIPEDSDY